ncbi:MAG TPA: lipopolysaccharide kinase InaA family protein [Gemmatimonadaceae bacterium]|jgi:hypothetical protein
MSRSADLPAGFVRFTVGTIEIVCADYVADAARKALEAGSLYQYAANHPTMRALSGRHAVYAATLPHDVERVVVRRNHHGGMFGPVIGELFLYPTRAPHELETSERLRRAGVLTPTMLGYAIYPALPGLCRVDVMSREVVDSFDLSTVLMDSDLTRRLEAWRATQQLVVSLNEIGARHHDLNVKNILLRHAPRGGGLEAFVLDVDRVEFVPVDGKAAAANAARLIRSAKKWQTDRGASISDAEIAEVSALLYAC